jgi:hypothetical protein
MAGEIHRVLTRSAATFHHVTGFSLKAPPQHRPDRLMIAVKGRRIEAAIGLGRPRVPTEFDDMVSHHQLPRITAADLIAAQPATYSRFAAALSADDVYALTPICRNSIAAPAYVKWQRHQSQRDRREPSSPD